MFEKSLQDLVKGIRSNKRDPSAFISQSIQEIKQELRNVDPFVKAQVCVGGWVVGLTALLSRTGEE